jgi:hypothetical protein
MNCGHSLIEPNGNCIFCGLLATLLPGMAAPDPHFVVVPRRMVARVKADLAAAASPVKLESR